MNHWRNKLKDDWRGWLWNRISERVSTRDKRRGTVLYLPGSDDAERAHALSRGFASHSLIGIERNKHTAKALRKSGTLCVHADLQDAVEQWPRSWPVSVIDFDLCGGLDTEVLSTVDEMCSNPALSNCVVAFNMRRGQDIATSFEQRILPGTNRAMIFMDVMRTMVSFSLMPTNRREITEAGTRKGCRRYYVEQAHEISVRVWAKIIAKLFKPVTFTYNSKQAKYDSVVFTWNRQRMAQFICSKLNDFDLDSEYSRILQAVAGDPNAYQKMHSEFSGRKKLLRQIAAVRAHQTMRKQA